MENLKNLCVVLVLIGVAWAAANWTLISNAWKYRKQISEAQDLLNAFGGG